MTEKIKPKTTDELLGIANGGPGNSVNFEFSVVQDKRSGKPKIRKKKGCGCGPLEICPLCPELAKTETEIENEILNYLEKVARCLAYRTPTKGRKVGNIRLKAKRHDRVGKSDIACCLHGRYIAIEVKKPGETQDPDQETFECDVEMSSGEYWLVESVEQVERKIFEFMIKHDIKSNRALPKP